MHAKQEVVRLRRVEFMYDFIESRVTDSTK